MEGFFDETAEVGSEEEEQEFDEEGEATERPEKSKTRNGDLDDSSEEDDDDDEEEARKVREGFIDDDDEDEGARRDRKREKKKRRREEREEDEVLDEEDLDLIGELHPDFDRRQVEKNKFKRLKRGHREDRSASEARGVEDIFFDEEEGADGVAAARGRAGVFDDMDDFIEQDEFPDEEGGQMDEDAGIRAPKKAGFADLQSLRDSGLDEADLEDMRGAFGDGDEFGWALEAEQENNEEQNDPTKPLELKDVFEPSQLIEKMLTDEDNNIRLTDVPERFQLARKPYKDLSTLSDDEMAEYEAEEAKWVANMLFPKKRLAPALREPFESAVKTVLRFMNVEDYEPAFIFQNRKDYLIHSEQVTISPDQNNPNGQSYEVKAEKLLNQTDLWDILEQDLKFRAFTERRDTIKNSLLKLKEMNPDFDDTLFTDLIPLAVQIDDLQDLQDYLNFQYSAELKEAAVEKAESNGVQKRARGARSIWDKVRQSPAYHLVRAFGITADQLAVNADKSGRRTYTDDPETRPDDMADTLVRDPDLKTGQDVITSARAMYVEEIVMNPRMRRHMRQLYYASLVFDVHRTEKGLKAINEGDANYDFKYLRNQQVRTILVERPEMFLRMLEAESNGLIEVRVRLQGEKKMREDLQKAIESDNFSEVADAWNIFRREALDAALAKLHGIISKGVKDNLRTECENKIAGYCRDAYTAKLDQAPFKPKGMELGTLPRVLALTNGEGNRGDAICWAYLEENGRMLENGKFTELRLPSEGMIPMSGNDVGSFRELVERRKPDVIAVSGWSVEARRLYKDLQDIVDRHNLIGAPWVDDDDMEQTDPLPVVIADGEVAKFYHNSRRAHAEYPAVPPLTRYAIALAKYMQDPMKEYAALGRDITSISFDPNQRLVPQDKLLKYLETSMVDMVNMVGVEINEAASDQYTANLLPYVCGLGPRKAAHMIKVINQSDGDIATREELVGDVDRNKRQAVGPKVWTNCASFLYITYDESDAAYDYLDNTRIHPEDYEIARKMAADALEMDEEDIKAEVDENGNNAVVRKLVKDDDQDKVNDLMLEQYAEQLETQFSQKKRATLETIRAELQHPYEELRRSFTFLTTDEIFTMLTGETRDSLPEGTIISVVVKRTFADHIDVRLDCGIDGGISASEYPEDIAENQLEARNVWAPHQLIQAKLMFIDRKKLSATLTLREHEMRKTEPKIYADIYGLDEWDEEQEARDKKEAAKATDGGTLRAQRVIKHPLFRPFNSRQAEDWLATQSRGDCVIRPSSKGPDHLAVTWKVHEDMYQHIDVLELHKENEFSVGRTLKVGKYTYSDLDELIVLHVKAMAKKVDEMMGDERYQNGSRSQTEQWLTTYTEANPKRSMYAFCLNKSHPGYFDLCFKAGQNAPQCHWPVKVIPNAFELQKNKYPDMRALKNGFKLLFANQGPGAAINGGRR